MQCPVCKEPMVTLELNNVEIDYCFDCGGIWLDRGELEELVPDKDYLKKILKTFKVKYFIKEKKRLCPICNKKMKKVLVGEEVKTLLDICPKKHGIWFDSGELYNIISLGKVDPENKILSLLKKMFKNKMEETK